MTAWETKNLPIFNGLNPIQINNLIGNANKVNYLKGQLICHFNDKSNKIFIILRGSTKMLSKNGELLGILQENDIFNEIGFVYELPCCTSFVAIEDSQIMILDKTLVENLARTDSEMKETLTNNILNCLKRKSESLEESEEDLVQLEHLDF